MKLLSVFPLTGNQDCSRNGIVNRCAIEDYCGGIMNLVDGTNAEISEWASKQSADTLSRTLVLVKRILWGEQHWFVVPYQLPKDRSRGIRTFGGNFVSTSDSRFKEYTPHGLGYPLPAHDRFETQEEYDTLCR